MMATRSLFVSGIVVATLAPSGWLCRDAWDLSPGLQRRSGGFAWEKAGKMPALPEKLFVPLRRPEASRTSIRDSVLHGGAIQGKFIQKQNPGELSPGLGVSLRSP